MKELIYSTLNTFAPCFYREAPNDFIELPVITYYFVLNQPLFQADNSFSKSRRIIFNVDVFSDSDVEVLALQVTDALMNVKAILRSETDISEDGIFGVRLEFEIINFVKI